MFQGLRTVIYHVTDLDRAKAWYMIENPHFSLEATK